jgi:hypothetical protein
LRIPPTVLHLGWLYDKVIRAVHTKEAERLKDTADCGSEDEWWANAVTWYHKNIANPENDEHCENMLGGYPTKKLLLDIS